jgi:hypothetical protein
LRAAQAQALVSLSTCNQTKLDKLNGYFGRIFIEITKEKEEKMEKIGLTDFFVPPQFHVSSGTLVFLIHTFKFL